MSWYELNVLASSLLVLIITMGVAYIATRKDSDDPDSNKDKKSH